MYPTPQSPTPQSPTPLSARLRRALPSTLLAVGALALYFGVGIDHDALPTVLSGVPLPLRLGLTALATALAGWRTAVHLLSLRRLDPAAPDLGVQRVRALVLALRAALLGACAAALGLGWLHDSASLTGLALVIGLEELYETTMVLGVLELASATERGEWELPAWGPRGVR